MRPKEIQEQLGHDADRIKFFKKQEVFFPENPPSGNHRTEYTEKDFEALKLLMVLTKMGLTCGDIKKLQEGSCTLMEAAQARMISIEDELRRKRNSMELLSQILFADAEYETFDADYFWGVIQSKEASGEDFITFEDLYDDEGVSLIRFVECPSCHKEEELDLEEYLYDQSSYEKENGMGPDIVYSFDSEDSHECSFCGKMYTVSGWIREYPIGAYDSEEIYVGVMEDGEGDAFDMDMMLLDEFEREDSKQNIEFELEFMDADERADFLWENDLDPDDYDF